MRFYDTQPKVNATYHDDLWKKQQTQNVHYGKLEEDLKWSKLILYHEDDGLKQFFGSRGIGKEHAEANMDKTFAQLIEEGVMTHEKTFSGSHENVKCNNIRVKFTVV